MSWMKIEDVDGVRTWTAFVGSVPMLIANASMWDSRAVVTVHSSTMEDMQRSKERIDQHVWGHSSHSFLLEIQRHSTICDPILSGVVLCVALDKMSKDVVRWMMLWFRFGLRFGHRSHHMITRCHFTNLKWSTRLRIEGKAWGTCSSHKAEPSQEKHWFSEKIIKLLGMVGQKQE